MPDRIYDIIHYEHVSDIGMNMVEFNIIPDEDLILYLRGLPKLEPQVQIEVSGYEKDSHFLFQCNYYATVDNISSFYQSNVDYIVLMIHTNKANLVYEYLTFPKAHIKQKEHKKDKCERLVQFKGSQNPAQSVYNPLLHKFSKAKNVTLRNKNNVTQSNFYWKEDACSHGVCKAEQTTEPPLLNSILKDNTIIEYFEHDQESKNNKHSKNIICFNQKKLYFTLIIVVLLLVVIFLYTYKYYLNNV